MWSAIILILVILIFILSVIKISMDVRRKRSKSIIIKEGVILLLIIIVLIIADTKFIKEGKINEKSAEGLEGETQTTIEEDRERRLLSQIQDYIGELNDTNKPQVQLNLKQGMEYKTKKGHS